MLDGVWIGMKRKESQTCRDTVAWERFRAGGSVVNDQQGVRQSTVDRNFLWTSTSTSTVPDFSLADKQFTATLYLTRVDVGQWR